MNDIYTDYRPANFTSRAEVVAEVTEIAEEIFDADLADSYEEARQHAWMMEGGLLYSLYRALPPDIPPTSTPVAKSHRSPSLRDEIYDAARYQAMIQQLKPGNFSRTIEDLIDEVWTSPEGSTLYGLYASAFRDLPASEESLVAIRKRAGDQYDGAIEILREWLSEDE